MHSLIRRRLFKEAVNADNSFKVVFLTGGTQSEKDAIKIQNLKGFGLREIDSDQAYDYLLGKKSAPENTESDSGVPDDEEGPVASKANGIMQAKKSKTFGGSEGLLVNAVSDDADMIRLMKDEFEKKGYDTAMVFVTAATPEPAASTQEPPMPGMSPAPPPTAQLEVKPMDGLMKNMATYKKMFGDYFFAATPTLSTPSMDTPEEESGFGDEPPDEPFDKKKKIVEAFLAKKTKPDTSETDDGSEPVDDQQTDETGFGDETDQQNADTDSEGIWRELKAFLEAPPKMHAARDWYRFHAQKRAEKDDPVKRHVFSKEVEQKKNLTEGVHDRGNFKVVFMAGGTGSGKDYVLKKALGGLPFKEVNSDHAYEYLMKKHKLDFKMPEHEAPVREPLRQVAKELTKERLGDYFDGRLGMVINGTGDEPEKIKAMKAEFEAKGYETAMLFVGVQDEISKKRNHDRFHIHGNRMVPEPIRKEKWDQSVKALDQYKDMFGYNFMLVDASDDANGTPEERKNREAQHLQVFRQMKNFSEAPPRSEIAKQWYKEQQVKGRGYNPNIERTISPLHRRMQNPPKMDVPVDYNALSNVSLGLRQHYGDHRAGQILAQRILQKKQRITQPSHS
jgi:hypothetical protein